MMAQISILNPTQAKGEGDDAMGFSLIELMLATLVIFIVVTGSIELTLRSLKSFNQGVAREALESAITEDIGWLRAYSKSWHCEVGPYQGCKVKTKGLASAINYRPEIYDPSNQSDYQAFRQYCLNRLNNNSTSTPAHQMLYDAASISTSEPYYPPNPIVNIDDPTTETDESTLGLELTLSLANAPKMAQSYKIYRTLNVDPGGNSITVRYFTKTTDDPTLAIHKSNKLFVEATAWCP